jgi:hypothetical protein
MQKQDTKPKLRADLTAEQREKAERIGRIEFKSAGVIRKPRYSAEAVDKAIASSNRSGRRIGRQEARAIHSLLKGRC